MISAATTYTRSAVPSANLDHLFTSHHSDPHSIPGTHPGPDGTEIRTYRLDTEKVRVIGRDALGANGLG